MSKGRPHGSGLVILAAVGHALAFELISDRVPLSKLMAKELTFSPMPVGPCWLVPWVSTYKIPEGREEELPQLSRNKLRAHMATSATTPPILFDICTPSRFPSAGDALPAVTEPEACG
jgi:hypothetical protein